MKWLVRLLFLAGALRRSPPPRDEEPDVDPRDRRIVSTPRVEWSVALLLVGAGLLGAAFAVLVAAWPNTQILGGTLGGACLLLAAALILAGKRMVPQETEVEERTASPDPREQHEAATMLREGVEGVSRRKLIVGAAGVAGTGIAAAAILPITAWGPSTGHRIDNSPWRRGRRLVDENDRYVSADDLEVGSVLVAFPEGASREDIGAPVMVLRLDPATLALPPARRAWAPEGILAYSRICTHAACAVNMLRYPLFAAHAPGPGHGVPALVCPCHFSTFDPQRAGRVIYGPAGRPLPQLPLGIEPDRRLVATGGLSGSVGPAWWGTKRPRT